MLPPTYYDFVKKIRPFVVDMAEADAKDLRQRESVVPTIGSVDEYNSRFAECLARVDEEWIERAAVQSGMPIETLRRDFEQIKPMIRADAAALYQTVSQEYHSVLNFALQGKKVFHFSDNLAEHLANTEVNVKTELIELPFPSCLFVFTADAVVRALHNIRGESGRWDSNVSGLDYSAPVSVFLTTLPAAPLPGRKLLMVAFHARLPGKSYLALKRELYLGEGWTLEQALRTDWERLTPDDLGAGYRIDTVEQTFETAGDGAFYTDGLGFFRTVLNAVLYLASEQAERHFTTSPRKEMEEKAEAIMSSVKRKKRKEEARRHSYLDYDEVGRTIGTITVQPGDTAADAAAGTKSVPMVRFMVRGHWRQQPCGPGREERKLTWVRPYYKGPDIAATINRPYVVK